MGWMRAWLVAAAAGAAWTGGVAAQDAPARTLLYERPGVAVRVTHLGSSSREACGIWIGSVDPEFWLLFTADSGAEPSVGVTGGGGPAALRLTVGGVSQAYPLGAAAGSPPMRSARLPRAAEAHVRAALAAPGGFSVWIEGEATARLGR